MISEWTRHLKDQKKKAAFEQYVLGSKELLNRQKDILTEMKDAVERKELASDTFEVPNWDYVQARNIGYKAALRDVQTLITVDQQKETK